MVAVSALTRSPLPDWSLGDLFDFVASSARLPRQAATDQAFGQPPVTVFWHQVFRMDLLFWHLATVGIHQHKFCGAFTVVHGLSLESRYHFRSVKAVARNLHFGQLDLTAAELLGRGDVRPIPYGANLIHSVLHLDAPTVTLVVRTPQDRDHGAEFEYRPPFLAIDPSGIDETAVKKLQMLGLVLRTEPEQYERVAGTALDGADLLTTFRILEHARLHASKESLTRLSSSAEQRYPEVGLWLLPVLEEHWRRQMLLSRQRLLAKWEHRFFFSLLAILPNKRAIERLIRCRYPADDPLGLLEKWVGELSGCEGTGIDLDEPMRIIFQQLVRRKSMRDIVASLHRQYPSDGVESRRSEIKSACELMRSSPILKPLFC
jgi:hypothetical protein